MFGRFPVRADGATRSLLHYLARRQGSRSSKLRSTSTVTTTTAATKVSINHSFCQLACDTLSCTLHTLHKNAHLSTVHVADHGDPHVVQLLPHAHTTRKSNNANHTRIRHIFTHLELLRVDSLHALFFHLAGLLAPRLLLQRFAQDRKST